MGKRSEWMGNRNPAGVTMLALSILHTYITRDGIVLYISHRIGRSGILLYMLREEDLIPRTPFICKRSII